MDDVATTAHSGDESELPEPTRRERVHEWIRGRQEQLEEAKGTSATVGFAFDALSYDTDTGAAVLAAALGFRLFLFQVPYAAVFVIGAAIIHDWTGYDVQSAFHAKGIGQLTAASVASAAQLSGWARFTGLVLALYALFLASRALVKVLFIVHALVWDIPRTKVKNATRAALVFIGVVTVLVLVSGGVSILRGRFALGGLALVILYTLIPFVAWWAVSWLLPHRDCPLIALAPGSAVFAVGAELLFLATVIWFPHHIKNKSEVYGSIGISLALLLWAYLLGRLITVAAVLNAALWARFGTDSAHPVHVDRPPWKVPLMNDRFTRIWARLFGEDEPGPSPPDGRDPP
jgi:uncharacterized BrkB/YihY/UPF0761 family membrane protein